MSHALESIRSWRVLELSKVYGSVLDQSNLSRKDFPEQTRVLDKAKSILLRLLGMRVFCLSKDLQSARLADEHAVRRPSEVRHQSGVPGSFATSWVC